MQMTKFIGSAFTGENCTGNPATTILFPESFPLDETLSRLAIENRTPVSNFLVRKSSNQFEIRYFLPDGTEIPYCGHGTIFTTKALSENELIDSNQNVEYFLNPKQTEVKSVIGKIKDGRSYADFPYGTLYSVPDPEYKIKDGINKVFPNTISQKMEFIECKEDNDLLVICDINVLRQLDPNLNELRPLMKELKVNGICFTAQSDNPEYNYETRLFDPGLSQENRCEDFACGSANMYTGSYWNQKLKMDKFKVLYPYQHYTYGTLLGGKQTVDVDKLNRKISVGGNVTVEKSIIPKNMCEHVVIRSKDSCQLI